MEPAEEAADVAIGAAVMEHASANLAAVTVNAETDQTVGLSVTGFARKGFWHSLGFDPVDASITPARANLANRTRR